MFTGLAFGLSFDRHVDLPLAARGDYLRAPLSRISWTIGISFIDFAMTDEQGNHLRTQVMPFTVEQGLAKQSDDSLVLDRRTTALETAMFRFIASDDGGSGTMHGASAVGASSPRADLTCWRALPTRPRPGRT